MNLKFLKKGQLPILIFMIISLLFFTIIYLKRQNYEFIIYIGVIIFFFLLILYTNNKINYNLASLWGLSIWSLMHMSGGYFTIGNTRLYEIIIINMSKTYPIFKYDQLVHIIGFCVATLILYDILKPLLIPNLNKNISLSIIIVMAGLGIGALNEIIEFFAVVILPKTGVGGYINTSLDLVSDLIGSLLALIIIKIQKK
jgi:uncharacterized membrane protein YjdF